MSSELNRVRIEDSEDPVLELCKHVVKLRIDLATAQLRIAQLTPINQDNGRSELEVPDDPDSRGNGV